MRNVLKVMFILVVGVGPGCAVAPTDSQPQLQCPAGTYVLGTECAWDPVTITIGPGVDAGQLAHSIPADAAGCFAFSANPMSVHRDQLVEWINNTSTTITIYQSPSTPLVTVAPGQTSAGTFWSNAGTVTYRPSTCNASTNTPFYGVITITLN
jgi:hypothetical protein